LLRHDGDAEPAASQSRASRSAIHVLGDPVEHVLERGVRHRDGRQHLGPEDARANAAEPSERAEPVTGSRRGVDGRAPVGSDTELVWSEGIGLGRRDELDRLRRSLLEARIEPGDRVALRQSADVDSGDMRPRRQLARRAGERQTDEKHEHAGGDSRREQDRGE
jgi:hypothetical protein